MIDVNEIMRQLSSERPLFHSEADFQHALAWKVHEVTPQARIRLEVASGRFDKRERIDILVRLGEQVTAIELKYKKRRLDYDLEGEKFSLANDGAHDIGRYDFVKDVARLENFVESDDRSIGHAILLTNDDLYWRRSTRGINSAAFFLHEGRVIDYNAPLSWHESTGKGTMKGRAASFKLRANRTLFWTDYSTLSDAPNGTFRFLNVTIGKSDASIGGRYGTNTPKHA